MKELFERLLSIYSFAGTTAIVISGDRKLFGCTRYPAL